MASLHRLVQGKVHTKCSLSLSLSLSACPLVYPFFHSCIPAFSALQEIKPTLPHRSHSTLSSPSSKYMHATAALTTTYSSIKSHSKPFSPSHPVPSLTMSHRPRTPHSPPKYEHYSICLLQPSQHHVQTGAVCL